MLKVGETNEELALHFGRILGLLSMGDGVEHWRAAGQLLQQIWEALQRGDRGDQAFITALAAHAESMVAMRGAVEACDP